MKLLQNRLDHLVKAKDHNSALDETRQNLSTLIDDAYYASHIADDIPSFESMITEIDFTASLISERLNSLADSNNDLVKQDTLLIEQAPKIVRSLRTRISH